MIILDFIQITMGMIAFITAFITILIFIKKSVYLVQQAEVIVIERLGKFDRILQPGLHIIIPFIIEIFEHMP